jgi:multiple sugar transport system substrate-binding protein
MKHTARIAGLALAATLSAGVLAGCSASGGDDAGAEAADEEVTLELVWWGNDSRAEMYQQAIDVFEEKHPNITVNGNFADFPSYWNARSTEVAARALPDVMQFDQANLIQYGTKGALLDLAPYLDDQLDLSTMDDVIVQAGEIGGAQVGTPVGTGTLALFVNPALAEAAGVEPLDPDYTWDDLNEWIQDVTAAGTANAAGSPVYGGYDQGITMWFFLQWLLQNGVEPFDEDGNAAFDQDDVVEYMDLTTPLREAGAYFPPDRATQIAPADGFAQQETASSLTWDSFFARYTDVQGLQTLPVPTGPEGDKSVFYTVLHLAGAANTEHPEEVAMLLDFFANDPEVAGIFGTSRGVPPSQEQLDALEFEEGSLEAQSLAYRDSLAEYETVPSPTLPESFATLESAWVRLNGDLMYGKITVDQFAEQWWAEAEQAGL